MTEELALPTGAQESLMQSLSLSNGNSRFSVYFDTAIPASKARTICKDAEEDYEKVIQMEVESFLDPIVLEVDDQSLQDVLVYHFDRLQHTLKASSAENARNLDVYPYGFLFLYDTDVVEEQAMMVHCDKRKKQWYISVCCASVSKLAYHAKDLIMDEAFFEDIQQEILDHGGQVKRSLDVASEESTPVMFALFSTGMELAAEALFELDPDDEGKFDIVFDPNNMRYLMSWERMVELFPVTCSNRPCDRGLFVCVDNDNPVEQGVLAISMDWDRNIDGRSDEELQRIGRESVVTTERCNLQDVYALLMARSGAEPSI